MITRIFPYCVGALELGAGIVYIWKGERLLGAVWIAYAFSAAALGYRG